MKPSSTKFDNSKNINPEDLTLFTIMFIIILYTQFQNISFIFVSYLYYKPTYTVYDMSLSRYLLSLIVKIKYDIILYLLLININNII